jgi:hypothetical protein
MIELIKKDYSSKADSFLLPLTGLKKESRYEIRSYLFWNDVSIEDFKLTVVYKWKDYDDFLEYCRKEIFPILDKKGYLVESHDTDNSTIFVLDISEWAIDINMFLSGKYSKFSKEAKSCIQKYHLFNKNQISINIYSTLYPDTKVDLLDKLTPIEYVSKYYGIDINDLLDIGEIGGIYIKENEILTCEVYEKMT